VLKSHRPFISHRPSHPRRAPPLSSPALPILHISSPSLRADLAS
jgi:hypothetical protein